MPVRQLTPEQEERLRQLQQLPREALSIEQQRERMLLESIRTAEQAAKKAALLSVIRSNPTAPPEDIALKAAVLYKQLKSSLTAPEALEQILAQEPNAQVHRAMATAVAEHTGSPSLLSRVGSALMWPLRALGWLQMQTTGRIWTGIKSAQEGEGFWEGFIHPERYEAPILTEEELPESWSPFAKKTVSLLTEIAGSILTDPLTYIGVGKVSDIAKAGKWVRKGADVAEEAAKLAQTVDTAREAAITAAKTSRQMQSWAALAKALFSKKADDAVKQLAQQDEVLQSATRLLDEFGQLRKTYTSLARQAGVSPAEKESVRKLMHQISKDLRKLVRRGITGSDMVEGIGQRITDNLVELHNKLASTTSAVARRKATAAGRTAEVSSYIDNILPNLQELVSKAVSDELPVENLAASIDNLINQIDNIYKGLKSSTKQLAKVAEGATPYGTADISETVQRLKTTLRNLPNWVAKQKTDVLNTKVAQIQDDFVKLRHAYNNTVSELRQALYDKLTTQTGVLERSHVLRQGVASFEQSVKKRIDELDELFEGAEKAQEAYKQAVEAAKPKWALTFKVPLTRKELILADVQPLAERAQRVATAVQMFPGIRPVAEWFTRHFRVLAPVPRKGTTVEELLQLQKDIPEVANVARSLYGAGEYVAKQTLDRFIKDIPADDVARWASYLAEARRTPEVYAAMLTEIPEAIRDDVIKAVQYHDNFMNTVTQELMNAFDDAPGYFGDDLIDNYVSHIILDSPGKYRKKLEEAFEADESKRHFLDALRNGTFRPSMLTAEKARGPARGASAYFTHKRLVDTIEQLKAMGINVVDDIRVIDAVYAGVAEVHKGMKQIADVLRMNGYIRPADRVAGLGWEAAEKVFPWLEGQRLAVHPEFVRLFNNLKGTLFPASSSGSEYKALTKAFDTVSSIFKGMVTSTRPSFHVMNTLGNLLLMRMAGIKYADQARAFSKAVSILAGKHPKAKEILDEFMKQGLHGQSVFADFSIIPGELAKELMDVLEAKTGGVIKKIKTVVLPRRGGVVGKMTAGPRWIGEQVDNLARLAAFVHYLDSGMTPAQAAKLVRQTLFDYNLLTTTEKAIRRYVVPFYSWVRNALPRSLITLLTQPGAITGYEHIADAFQKVLAASVDRSQLPEWLQEAIILGTDEDGGVLYINPHPPWEDLFMSLSSNVITQMMGLTQSETDPGRNLAGMLHPVWSALWTLVSGVDPRTGKTYPEDRLSNLPVPVERALAAAKQFLPWTEVERASPESLGRPRITTTRFFGSPVVRYDLPYATAVDVKKASSLLDEVMQKLEAETGTPLPTTADVSQAERLIDRYSNYVRLIREAQSDPWKAQFINALIQGYTSPVAAMEVLQDNADLLLGSRAEVVMRLRKLLTPENFAKLRVYLGRTPSLKDFFEHRTALESGTLEAVSPEQRRAQALLEELERIRTYGQALQ